MGTGDEVHQRILAACPTAIAASLKLDGSHRGSAVKSLSDAIFTLKAEHSP
ncbi:hypothetical protein [Pseudomonas sp. 24 E 1]|nr:hypothetical protein [Pseudomonas sp. 35 E 8]CRM36014.1 hypothetical protein [Pseudomonas sp. 24 E 1]CRM56295.1 hypothetical protein [Pseudomonas sp. 58 R 12]CRM67373.1 hypothetical protein [Pseudomonas sp. 24 R 17]CRM74421.1 hypothetical protein [Pseudomonas sp. 52 E 6]